MIEITHACLLSEQELTFVASRSGGPGGQNVNKVSTKVTLLFDVASSPSLSKEQRQAVLGRLATRISKDGVLHVASQRHRTQAANREAALERFIELLRGALAVAPERVESAVPRAAKRRQIDAKKRRGRIKQQRAERFSGEE